MWNENVLWSDIIKLPDPHAIRSIFYHVLVYFWKAENSCLPRDLSEVQLTIDHQFYQKPRFYLYEVHPQEWVGIWDDTPYHVGYASHQDNSKTFSHKDYRHEFQSFLKSFLKAIQPYTVFYPSLDCLYQVVSRFPLLQWKCPLCHFLEKIRFSPSLIMFLLTHERKEKEETLPPSQVILLAPALTSALERFFTNFEKICEQTRADPLVLLANLIGILETYLSRHTADQIEQFEKSCARDMKTYLYQQLKYLQTKDIAIHSFPRDMMVARDVFSFLFPSSPPPTQHSPGTLFLLLQVLLQDNIPLRSTPTLVCQGHMREMTIKEQEIFGEYHPLLRHVPFVGKV